MLSIEFDHIAWTLEIVLLARTWSVNAAPDTLREAQRGNNQYREVLQRKERMLLTKKFEMTDQCFVMLQSLCLPELYKDFSVSQLTRAKFLMQFDRDTKPFVCGNRFFVELDVLCYYCYRCHKLS